MAQDNVPPIPPPPPGAGGVPPIEPAPDTYVPTYTPSYQPPAAAAPPAPPAPPAASTPPAPPVIDDSIDEETRVRPVADASPVAESEQPYSPPAPPTAPPAEPTAPPAPPAAPDAPNYYAPAAPAAPTAYGPVPVSPYTTPQANAPHPGYGTPVPPAYGATVPPAYGQQPYAQQPYGYGAVQPKGLSIASMITGLVGAFLSLFSAGFLPALAAVILGFMARKSQPYAKAFWLTGLISGFAGIGFSLLWFLFILIGVLANR